MVGAGAKRESALASSGILPEETNMCYQKQSQGPSISFPIFLTITLELKK